MELSLNCNGKVAIIFPYIIVDLNILRYFQGIFSDNDGNYDDKALTSLINLTNDFLIVEETYKGVLTNENIRSTFNPALLSLISALGKTIEMAICLSSDIRDLCQQDSESMGSGFKQENKVVSSEDTLLPNLISNSNRQGSELIGELQNHGCKTIPSTSEQGITKRESTEESISSERASCENVTEKASGKETRLA